MPDTVESNIERALDGVELEDEDSQICDFSVEEQNDALESQGIQTNTSGNYKLVVGETMTYVVVGVFINENDEVLMMQEAKKSCAGKWYSLTILSMQQSKDINFKVFTCWKIK